MTPVRWSVLIPTFNRPLQLRACLKSFAEATAPAGGFEIIVVNDGGSAVDAPVTGDVALTVINQANSGPGIARNSAAAIARGEFLAFTDDDCRPAPDWLAELDLAMRNDPDVLVGGMVVNGLASNQFATASQDLVDFVRTHFDGVRRERFFTTNNVAVARQAFLDSGGFDATFRRSGAEDREYCDRWHSEGRKSQFVSTAIVYHHHDLSLRRFLRQHHSYGRGATLFRTQRARGGRTVRIDPSFYVESIRHGLRRGPRNAMLIGLAHASYLAGLLLETLKQMGNTSPVPEP